MNPISLDRRSIFTHLDANQIREIQNGSNAIREKFDRFSKKYSSLKKNEIVIYEMDGTEHRFQISPQNPMHEQKDDLEREKFFREGAIRVLALSELSVVCALKLNHDDKSSHVIAKLEDNIEFWVKKNVKFTQKKEPLVQLLAAYTIYKGQKELSSFCRLKKEYISIEIEVELERIKVLKNCFSDILSSNFLENMEKIAQIKKDLNEKLKINREKILDEEGKLRIKYIGVDFLPHYKLRKWLRHRAVEKDDVLSMLDEEKNFIEERLCSIEKLEEALKHEKQLIENLIDLKEGKELDLHELLVFLKTLRRIIFVPEMSRIKEFDAKQTVLGTEPTSPKGKPKEGLEEKTGTEDLSSQSRNLFWDIIREKNLAEKAANEVIVCDVNSLKRKYEILFRLEYILALSEFFSSAKPMWRASVLSFLQNEMEVSIKQPAAVDMENGEIVDVTDLFAKASEIDEKATQKIACDLKDLEEIIEESLEELSFDDPLRDVHMIRAFVKTIPESIRDLPFGQILAALFQKFQGDAEKFTKEMDPKSYRAFFIRNYQVPLNTLRHNLSVFLNRFDLVDKALHYTRLLASADAVLCLDKKIKAYFNPVEHAPFYHIFDPVIKEKLHRLSKQKRDYLMNTERMILVAKQLHLLK